MGYLTFKALHLIFMVAWMAGLFYIFRLFVYHVENWDKTDFTDVVTNMERKLICYIMNPALVLTFTFGLTLIYKNPALLATKWLHLKLIFVSVLIGYHVYSYYVYVQMSRRQKRLSSKACRIINEVPTLVLIVSVLLAVLKPAF